MKEFDPAANAASIVSVTDRVRPIAIGAPVTSVHFLGERAAFVGAEENVFLVNGDGAISTTNVQSGGILCASADGARLVTGGDDGKGGGLGAPGGGGLGASGPQGPLV